MKKIFRPFEEVSSTNKNIIFLGWLVLLIGFWFISSFGDIHLFPTPKQVATGFYDLWNEGLVVHIFSSLSLCFQAVFYSVLISLVLAYLTPIPFFKLIGGFISKLRYLPLTGCVYDNFFNNIINSNDSRYTRRRNISCKNTWMFTLGNTLGGCY